MTEKIKPKLEDLIPMVGYLKYADRYLREEAKCYDLDGNKVAEFPKDYLMELFGYHLITSSMIGGSIGALASECIKYFFNR
ncbi:hypothetical protein GOV07_04830 [Candidatus Woesearchaeota archaeon]|nr:hypothetical protein [Candidatus Woesearchaeota archaeon]